MNKPVYKYFEMCVTSKAQGWLVRQAPAALIGQDGCNADVPLGGVAWGAVRANGGNWKLSRTYPTNGLFAIPVHGVYA